MAAMVNATACPAPMKATSNGAWQGDDPLDFALPLAILQICIVVVLTRFLAFLLRPLHQPRVIAEIIGGILLGPSALGRNTTFLNKVFPKRSLTVLDTLANIGLMFFLFLIGLELHLPAILRSGKRALSISLAGIALPFTLGVGTSFVLRSTVAEGARHAPFLVFMGVAISITAFPVLARILAELKLLSTDVGRLAMSAAAVDDVTAWILLALAIALSGPGSPLVSLWVFLTGIAFVASIAIFLRPALAWMSRRSPDGQPVSDLYVCAILVVVLAAGLVADCIGIHALFGAFAVGVVMPRDKDSKLAGALVEKIEDLTAGIFLPLYFVSSGLKTNIATIKGAQSWGLLVLVIITACVGKIGGVVTVSLLLKVPFREAITLGFLMNTKGLVELVVLNIGKDRHVLNDETFAIMVLMALFTTFITAPIVIAIYKPAVIIPAYKHRTILEGGELPRLMVCFHNNRSVPTLINLVESSRGARAGTMAVYAMHLVKLSERPSAMLMVQRPFWNKLAGRGGDKMMTVHFESYEQLSSVSFKPITVVSDLATIHDDILATAHRKRIQFIVLPFHKTLQLDGSMESLGLEYQMINHRVLQEAPCSVGVLIDRGLSGAAHVSARDMSCTIAVLFFGGPDDREALAYGGRMADHPGVQLVVVHFKTSVASTDDADPGDDDFVAEFKSRGSITYEEKESGSKEEIISAIKAMNSGSRYNMFLVGRWPVAAAFVDRKKMDFPELGPMGSYLASPDFSTTASVLVIQQYNGGKVVGEESTWELKRDSFTAMALA